MLRATIEPGRRPQSRRSHREGVTSRRAIVGSGTCCQWHASRSGTPPWNALAERDATRDTLTTARAVAVAALAARGPQPRCQRARCSLFVCKGTPPLRPPPTPRRHVCRGPGVTADMSTASVSRATDPAPCNGAAGTAARLQRSRPERPMVGNPSQRTSDASSTSYALHCGRPQRRAPQKTRDNCLLQARRSLCGRCALITQSTLPTPPQLFGFCKAGAAWPVRAFCCETQHV